MKCMSPQNVERCLEIIDKLCKYKTSSIYMMPIEPEFDNCPNYFEIIPHPMDFSTVRSKLTSNCYRTIDEFKEDVNLIFENSKTYNSKDSLFGLTAQFLQNKFQEMVQFFSEDGWQKKFDYLQQKIKDLISNAPSDLPKPYFNTSEIEVKRSQLSKIKCSTPFDYIQKKT